LDFKVLRFRRNSMPFGYHGKILHVDLNHLSIQVEEPSEEFYRKYMGGSALGLCYLLKYSPAGIDPLSPDNTLIMALSVLTGAPISGQSRITAVAKSPLTGAVGDSQAGGFFPAELKFAGYDAVILRGRAESPQYLWIHDGKAELRPAQHLKHKTTREVEELLYAELGDSHIQVLQSGIAGDNLVRFAALINKANRANGRTGMGAVMGSKNLKAIVTRGKLKPQMADKNSLIRLARWGAEKYPSSDVYSLGLTGTAGAVAFQNQDGGLPTRHWTSGVFEGYKAIDGETMAATILKERDSCYACTVRCKRVVEIQNGDYKVNPYYGGPEYETLSTFGSLCCVDNLHAVAYANQLCAMYGLDTISCGAIIAWAMDCFEQGLLTKADTDGLDLRFGNDRAMIEMIEKMAHREGFGDILAEGSERASGLIGRGTEDLVMTVKGQELPAHMPQVKKSMALIYAVNPFGADHASTEHDPYYRLYPERIAEIGLNNPQEDLVLNEEKVRFTLITQYVYSCLDSLSVCQFVFGPTYQLYSLSQLAEAVNAVTGWDVSVDELIQLGERRLNMLRAYNAREGFDARNDILPKKLFMPLVGGVSDGYKITEDEVARAIQHYYVLAGWNKDSGIPTRAKLQELGLEWIADQIGITS
jgi:aldehyde:ferredoxin oxidoreductase